MIKRPFCGVLTGLFLLLFASGVFGATKIYLPHETRTESQLHGSQTFSPSSLKSKLALTSREELKLLRKRTDRKNDTHLRYNQLFNGIPVWGHHIIVAQDQSGNVMSLHGTKVSDIADDIDITALQPSGLTAQDALRRMKERYILRSGRVEQIWMFKNEVAQKIIYVDNTSRARICYAISFFSDVQRGGFPSRPVIIIDAGTGEIIREFDALTYAGGVGPGGNKKTGKYRYGHDFPAFAVAESGSQCIMNTFKVKTWNMNHSASSPTVHAFDCYENTFKEINGGFCPLNDAHFFGGIVYDMYDYWFNITPLPFQQVLGVHYGNNFENAFWDGSEAIFGDGASYFYPLVGLNVVSHEISHGFTEQNSDLIYDGQSGGINEAFSDMAGEAAEYYLQGSNDFMVGSDIWKGPGSFRYMDDPPRDGWSIDSANDYYEGMQVHQSSGVFNKAFYKLATTPGWNTRMAFEVFVKANQYYWEPSTNFVQGAEGAYDAAINLGYPAQDVEKAFEAVQIFISAQQKPIADFTYATELLTADFTDKSTCNGCNIIAWHWEFGDGTESSQQHPTHTYAAGGTYAVALSVTDSNGQTDTASRSLQLTEDLPGPTAAFSFTANGLAVSFIDQSTVPGASIVGWHWEFGDGTESSQQHPTHTYAAGGTYAVALSVTDSNGQTDTASRSLTVSEASADYCESAGRIYFYQWITKVVVGEFSNSSAASGYSDFTSDVIEVQKATPYALRLSSAPPGSPYPKYWRIWADLNQDGDFDDAGEKLFEGSGSNDPTGTISVPVTALEGDTRLRVSMGLYNYPNPCGDFVSGEVEDYTLKISEGVPGPTEPVAAFDYSADGLTVSFIDQSTVPGASIVGWHWEFGDGTESSQQHPTHTYAAGGTYAVALSVTDSNGQTDTASRSLTVSEASADYCESASRIYFYQWITKVAVGEFSNSSDASGYSDFTSDVIEVQKETPYALRLSSAPPGTPYPKYWRIWADLNQDGDFDDAGEKLFEGSGSNDPTGTISVPVTALEGDTRLRVSMGLYNYPNPCGDFVSGEVEDYTLYVQ